MVSGCCLFVVMLVARGVEVATYHGVIIYQRHSPIAGRSVAIAAVPDRRYREHRHCLPFCVIGSLIGSLRVAGDQSGRYYRCSRWRGLWATRLDQSGLDQTVLDQTVLVSRPLGQGLMCQGRSGDRSGRLGSQSVGTGIGLPGWFVQRRA